MAENIYLNDEFESNKKESEEEEEDNASRKFFFIDVNQIKQEGVESGEVEGHYSNLEKLSVMTDEIYNEKINIEDEEREEITLACTNDYEKCFEDREITQEPGSNLQEQCQLTERIMSDACGGNAAVTCLICQNDSSCVTRDSLFRQICDVCYKKQYEDNYENLLDIKFSSCDICLSSFVDGVEQIQHDCTGPTVYICSYCNKGYKRRCYLELHLKNRRLKFNCIECKLSFCNFNEINDHNIVVHARKTEYTCASRTECLPSSSRLRKRVRRQSKPKRYSCSYCAKEFTNLYNFTRHTNTHTKKKIYKCTYCLKEFSNRNSIKKHVNSVHTKEKLYTCTYCMKVFTRSSSLNEHVNSIHTKEKLYTCTYCMKDFTRLSNLNQHIKGIHIKDQLYTCNVCMEEYSNRNSLKYHFNSVHFIEKLYECTYCLKKFTYWTTLNQHVSSVHNKEDLSLRESVHSIFS